MKQVKRQNLPHSSHSTPQLCSFVGWYKKAFNLYLGVYHVHGTFEIIFFSFAHLELLLLCNCYLFVVLKYTMSKKLA